MTIEKPKMTRAERSAANKRARAEQVAVRDAIAQQNWLERKARDAQIRADAHAAATELVPLDQAIRTGNELRALARSLTPLMMQRLVETALGDGKEAVNAMNSLLDRGWGKPVQPVAVAPGDVFMEMEDAQLDTYLMTNTSKYIEGELANVQRNNSQSNADGQGVGGTNAEGSPARPKRGKGGKAGKPPQGAPSGAKGANGKSGARQP